MGKRTASSPRAWHVQNSMVPTIEKARSNDAGPPVSNALPDATNKPVPTAHQKIESAQDSYSNALNEGVSVVLPTRGAWDVPMEPPMAIICRCLPFSFLARPAFAVSRLARCRS